MSDRLYPDPMNALLAATMLEAHERRCTQCQRGGARCFAHFALASRLNDAVEREARNVPPELFARERSRV